MSGADSSKFEITTTGATRTLSFENAPNFESPGDSGANNVYEVTVVVTDTEGNTDEQAIMVKVTNVEEFGSIEFSTLQPRVGFSVVATLTDPDNVNVDGLEWQWYREATITITDVDFNPSNLPMTECDDDTNINCSIKGATSAVYVPVDADLANSLTAVATYTDGNGDGKDYAAVTTGINNDVLANTINDAPVFPDMDSETEGRQTAQERSVLENTDAGVPIGPDDPVEAEDEDMNLTYSLGGPDAGSFDIVSSSGQLQTKSDLDKEAKDTYTVTVTAEDSFGLSSTITVTIKVTDVDEMPDLEGEAPDEYAENGTAAVATFMADDPEGKSITWSLAGTNAADFSIENGVLRFESSPDFEEAGGNNTYEITIRASDGGMDTTATKAVTIEVTNVEEPGTVMLSNLQPQVGVAIMATLDDPDNETTNTITWQWYRGRSPISGANNGVNTVESIYTPEAGDIGSALRAQAMYGRRRGRGQERPRRLVQDCPQRTREQYRSGVPRPGPEYKRSSEKSGERSSREHTCRQKHRCPRCSQRCRRPADVLA